MELPYYRPETSRSCINENGLDPERINNLLEILKNLELEDDIKRGNVELGFIRPELVTCTLFKLDDQSIANIIEEQIEGLGILAKFSLVFDCQAVDDLYGKVTKNSLLNIAPHRHKRFSNRWEEFVETMTCGASTAYLFYSQNGDAINKFRSQLGSWDVENSIEPYTIRGKFAIDNYNDLIHGSDSIESVENELAIIIKCLERKIPNIGTERIVFKTEEGSSR